ncbi:multidrug transporter [Mycobacterium sp. MS1601]|uniref:glucosamine-6-phosphate deaminase n=1 Tax=Mycobacterium sp. MS1601 TaxID=1936029 RepID=UPI00097962FB|nr:glucosamine-6-phosphate deaminase [Mycobacterium sp. MS1601]AQA05481.1 multidrug transporter [Mycobacterium sp. MS1601]
MTSPTRTIDIAPDSAAVGERVAARIAAVIEDKPEAVIGVATGSSPEPVYLALARRVRAGLDVSAVQWYALDEYLGLPVGHPQSYRSVLQRVLIAPLGADPATLHVPEGPVHDYEAAVTAAGVDIQLLGIGENGHIGFNEPGTSFAAITHRATLADSTRRANARFFSCLEDVPTECQTQGLATIMRAARIELVAIGGRKAAAVAAMLGEVTESCPASILQRHPDVHITLDPTAAAELSTERR